jgi:hypothetical protein
MRHGTIALLFGILLGFPLYGGVAWGWEVGDVEFWRGFHVSVIVNAVWIVAAGMAIPHLALRDRALGVLVWSLIVANYSPLAELSTAWLLVGATSSLPVMHGNWVAFGAGAVFAASSLMGVTLVIYGAGAALGTETSA